MNNSVDDNERSINNSGQSGNVAGRDINISNTTNINKNANSKHINSAIEKVLSGLHSITKDDQLCYHRPDTQSYKIEDKIDYNELDSFKDDVENYINYYYLVETQINSGSENDPALNTKIIEYIKQNLNKINVTHKNESNDAKLISLVESIKEELINWNAELDGDELTAVIYVIFYVFAECKIFKKPLPQGINNDIK
ncbi:ABC-three component system protein [Snodgrassella alvi]|uniref:ABC-three component system protein n=2 Tax=Snodgrassella alvi TaxID=1196083 RepID=UPI0009FF631D|nr:ABC-three component system protein [Snodgrassella alvi]ORF02457.1 hypothetical protein BGH97_04770 [Snodgrassella alvi]ORF09938.1 hypothetical protein BGH99_00510 [Snodgrassella alvi]ORF15394.1 hypothetical protein BGI02_03150 [Snodgrassella alvi]ORF15927.1 hypothetical protein BGI00_00205 [Snodgrassella alvi]ORF28044.1 hypothetical protein BGI06_00225 [Snodgrassella alvi]